MLIAAIGWPSAAGATSRTAPGAGASATTRSEEVAEPAGPGFEAGTRSEGAPRSESAPTSEGAPTGESRPGSEGGPRSESAPTSEGEPTSEPGSGSEAEPEAAPTMEQRRKDLLLEKALEHWTEGERLYQSGRYAESAAEFELSYAAVPAAATLYGMALSYERAGKPVEATRALGRYLALPDCEDEPALRDELACTELRADAEKLRAELRPRVGELVLSLGEGVQLREVRVAGRVVPLQDFPLVLLPGTVDVEVLGLGADERRVRPVTISGGDTTTFYVAPFQPEVVVRPDPPTGKDTEDPVDVARLEQRRRALRASFGVSAGLTAAAGIAVAVTGGLALYHERRFDAEHCRNDEDCEPSEHPYPLDHAVEFERYRPVANALVGVTVGLSVATALLGTFAFRRPAGRRTGGGEAGVRARSGPSVRLGATGVVVRW